MHWRRNSLGRRENRKSGTPRGKPRGVFYCPQAGARGFKTASATAARAAP